VGIVIERQRAASEQDGFIWYCEGCGDKLHDEYLHVADIEKDLPPVFKRFRDNHSDQNCKRCGTAISS
jgi:3-hydroxyanthranilate 3,4-dioxygenase